MPIAVRGETDHSIDDVVDALKGYEQQHLHAQVEVYRQSSVSIRVRIVDEDFAGISRADRHEIIWRCLETLPEGVQSQVSLLIALAPDEVQMSIANFEFDHPIPSAL